ncbi:hypothetical protein [Silvanigrella aquatica]|nr:hypothetical protein [Silvanigrella aquatica]
MNSSWVGDNYGNYQKTTGKWIKSENKPMIFQSKKLIDNLKISCAKIFSGTDPKQIYVTIKDSKISFQYPIVNLSDRNPLTVENLKTLNHQDIISYRYLLGLAYASDFAYFIEPGRKNTTQSDIYSYSERIKDKTGFEYLPYSIRRSEKSNVLSIAFINHK